MTEIYKELSVSEFYSKNRQLAGFDNPVKGAYTSIRELVENSLDSCELARILPEVIVDINKDKSNNLYTVKVVDNGLGIPKIHLSNAVGKVLFGSKYVLRQHRGELGMGGTMVFLNSVIETGESFTVLSSMKGSPVIYGYEMTIDVSKNTPIILKEIVKMNTTHWHGLYVKFKSRFEFQKALPKLTEYFRLTSVIVPYASLKLKFNQTEIFNFRRETSEMPKPAKTVKYHPQGINYELVKTLIENTDKKDLISFLTKTFQKVGNKSASEVLKIAKLTSKDPKTLTHQEISALVNSLKSYQKFQAPDTDALSVIGKQILIGSVDKKYSPEFRDYSSRKGVYQGHPYILEVVVAYGGKIKNPRKERRYSLLRFANKIPLIQDEKNCGLTKSFESLDFKRYQVDDFAPLLAIIHICSTHIPYKTVGKEFIAQDVEEIQKDLDNTLKDCMRKLSSYLVHRHRYEELRRRKSIFDKYLPEIAYQLSVVSGKPAEDILFSLKGSIKQCD